MLSTNSGVQLLLTLLLTALLVLTFLFCRLVKECKTKYESMKDTYTRIKKLIDDCLTKGQSEIKEFLNFLNQSAEQDRYSIANKIINIHVAIKELFLIIIFICRVNNNNGKLELELNSTTSSKFNVGTPSLSTNSKFDD